MAITLESVSSYNNLLTSISSYNSIPRVREGLDFSDFSNFVWFGSAEFEVENAVLSIQENYPNFDKWNISDSDPAGVTIGLDGTDDFINIPPSIIDEIDDYMKFELEFKPVSLNPSTWSGYSGLVRLGGNVAYTGMYIYIRETNDRIYLKYAASSIDTGIISEDSIYISKALDLEKWYSITGEVDGSNGYVSLSIDDGNSITTSSNVSTVTGCLGCNSTQGYSRIGNSSAAAFTDGRFKNVSLWKSETEKVSNWACNEGQGDILYDSINNYDCTVYIRPAGRIKTIEEAWFSDADTLSITSDDEVVNLYSSWKNGEDPYVEYFANKINDYMVTVTVTGADYAKGVDNSYIFKFPWFDSNNRFNMSQEAAINSYLQDAIKFDETNFKSFLKMIPDYTSEKDEDLKTVIQVIGHYLDDLYLSTKRHLDIYNFSYKFSEMPNASVLDAFIDSLGMGKFYQFTEKNLLDYYENIYGNDSQSKYSKKDFSKLLKIIFINNIKEVLKTKGTKESIRLTENIFGWPKGLVNVEEYIYVSEDTPSSGIVFDIPEIAFETRMVDGDNSSYNFTASFENIPLSAFDSWKKSVVFTFSLSGIENLQSGNWEDENPIFRLYTEESFNVKNRFEFASSGTLSGFILEYKNELSKQEEVWNFPLTADKYRKVNDNTVFTLVFEGAPGMASSAMLGFYNPSYDVKTTNNDDTSVSSDINGNFVYDIVYGTGSQDKADGKLISLVFFQQTSKTNIVPFEFKIYEGAININNDLFLGTSAHLMNHNTIYKTDVSSTTADMPTKWYRFNQFNESLSSIPDSSPLYQTYGKANLEITDPYAIRDLTLVKKQVIVNKKYTYKVGDQIDEIGIYPELDELNYIKANNKLRVYISPSKVINNLIDVLINYADINSFYGKPSDLYEKRYSVLTDLQYNLYNYLNLYSQSNKNSIDLKSFFDVLQQGYSENILNFIADNLIPAKSDLESGIFIENDKLDDQKYQWKRLEPDVIDKDANINSNPIAQPEDLEKSIDYKENVVSESENQYDSTNYNLNTVEISENQYDFFSISDTNDIISEDQNGGSDEINKNINQASTAVYEHLYWYLPSEKWEPFVDYQGSEVNICSITGSPLFGKSIWKNISQKTTSTVAYVKSCAHVEISNLAVTNNKNELFGSEDVGKLHIDLFRYGFNTPGGYVKVKVPSKSPDNNIPIIILNGLSSDDIYELPVTANNEYSLKLNDNGRTVDYMLNVNSTSSAYSQANTVIKFGNLGNPKRNVSLPIESTLLNKGSAGNGLVVKIILDESLQSNYSKVTVENDRIMTISVAESPYIVTNLLESLTSNTKVTDLFNIDISDLEVGLTGSSDDYKVEVFGEWFLENGSDEVYNIKNKEYKIEIINIYNNDNKEVFSIIPRSKSTMIDSRKEINDQSNSW